MKKGFTLAEILVSMGIIGIVSAMTIPSLVSEHKKQVYASQLSSAVSNLENAFTSMMATEGVESFSDTEFRIFWDDNTNFGGQLSKYYKSTRTKNITDIYDSTTPVKINSSSTSQTTIPASVFFISKNGIVSAFAGTSGEINESTANTNGVSPISTSTLITIDVNGKEKPNIYGRDIFLFAIGDDGILYPAGGKIFSLLKEGNANNTHSKTGSKYICDSQGGKGCAARLIENGYKMNY